MSVGGTGDLLSGCIAGLIAQGMSPWAAARLGCALLRTSGAAAALASGATGTLSGVPRASSRAYSGEAAQRSSSRARRTRRWATAQLR